VADKATILVLPPLSSEPAPAIQETPRPATAALVAPPAMLVAAYGALALGFAIWWLAGLVKLVRLIRSTVPVPAQVAALFRLITGDQGKSVRLLASDRIDLPLTFTLRQPIIVLPLSLCTTAEAADLRYCLAHEWSHIERRDIWSWHLATLTQV